MSLINNQTKDNKVNKKVIRNVVVILLVLSFCYLLLLYKNEGLIKEIELENATQVTNFVWDIDELYFGQDSMYLKGTFYKEGEPINYFNNRLLLREIESDIVYELPTESFPKKEVVAEEDEKNYRNILVAAESRKLDFVNKNYEIIFLYELNGYEYYQETGYTVKSWCDKNEK